MGSPSSLAILFDPKFYLQTCFLCYFFHTCPILEIQKPKLIRKMRGIQICGEKPEIKSASEK
jgi:hypothetical protein